MRRLLNVLALAAFATLLVSLPLAASDEPDTPEKKQASAKTKDGKAAKKKDELPTIDEAVKDMKRIDGLLPVYRKKDKLLALISNDMLDKDLMLATSIAGGGYFTGWQWSDMLVRFQRHDKKLLVLRPDTQRVTRKKGPITSAGRSF